MQWTARKHVSDYSNLLGNSRPACGPHRSHQCLIDVIFYQYSGRHCHSPLLTLTGLL